uniref:Putative secreted protein n=1 Tax=Anopheles triannulatus TaxID=58253 RepID=A0A2M4A8W8_9DIPT
MAARMTIMVPLAVALICLLQVEPGIAANSHIRTVLKLFRSIDLDNSKKSFYLTAAKYGIQTQLREPIMRIVGGYLPSAKVSEACLKNMIAEVYGIEGEFYAKFSYACENHDPYSVECLEDARHDYLTKLVELFKETKKCLRE